MNYHPDISQTGFVTREWVKLRYSISNSTLHLWQNEGYFGDVILRKPSEVAPALRATGGW